MLGPVFLNDTWHDEPPGMPLDDPSVVQGVTVVETVRTYDGRLFEPARHWPRLNRGLAYLGFDGLPYGLDPDILCRELLDRRGRSDADSTKKDEPDDLAIVLLVTPGRKQPTVVCHARPLPSYQAWYQHGVPLVVPETRQDGALPRSFKHRSRLHWWKADHEAKRCNPAALAWLLDADDVLTETASGNVVAVAGDRLLVADPSRVVPGVTQAIVEELVDGLNLHVERCDLTLGSLATCDELWMTSTGCGVVPVASVNGDTFRERAMYRRLQTAWTERFGFALR